MACGNRRRALLLTATQSGFVLFVIAVVLVASLLAPILLSMLDPRLV